MNEWALLKNGRIINVVMTSLPKTHMQQTYPNYEVADLYSLPPEVQQGYHYWNERP